MLALVAREGDVAPGTGAVFSQISSLAFNDSGQTAFTGTLSGLGVSWVNDRGIWFEGGGSLELVAREGNVAPGTNGIFSTSSFTFAVPVLNDSGQIVFWGSFTESNTFYSGLWAQRNGSLPLVARLGDNAPGTSETFSTLGPLIGGSPAIREFPGFNNAGQTAFLGNAGTSGAGIWSEGSGSLALVALAGREAPGTDAASFTFREFDNLVLNGAGQTAFTGETNNYGIGIWSEGNGPLALVAQEGDNAPGTDAAFNDLQFSWPTLNGAGQTAFRGRLTGPGVNFANDRGIWAQNLEGELVLIAREGDLLDVDDGPGTDYRTISTVTFIGGSGNEDGHASGFNDLGQLAFKATFTDGTSGIFVSNLVAVPEPGSLVLLSMGGLGLFLRCKRGYR